MLAEVRTLVRQRRLLQTLMGCVLVALVSGTNYVYSAYAPQLGQRLHLSHTQLNTIGIAGNVGVYCFAPISGWIIDKRGYRQPMFAAALLLLFGYGGIRHLFTREPPASPSSWPSAGLVVALSVFSFMAGAGGILGVHSANNAGVKNVPPSLHASVTGVMSSAFGLSAFLFSFVAKELFAGRTTSFLSVLMFGTSVPVFVGATIVQPVSPASSKLEDDPVPSGRNEESRPLLSPDDERVGRERDGLGGDTLADPGQGVVSGEDQERATGSYNQGDSLSGADRSSDCRTVAKDVHGWGLLRSPTFWILTGMVGTVGGPGLVYINNVGSIVQVLYASGAKEWDKQAASAAQAGQVSILSMCGFGGRLLIGFMADYSSHTYGIPRLTWLILSSSLGVLAQWMLTKIDNPAELWKVSGLVGVSYGTTFVIGITLVLESFGIAHFSQNSGILTLSSVLLGNIFNHNFGRNLDAHSPPPGQGDGTTGSQCLNGPMCYVDSIVITLGSCCLGLGLSIYALWRQWIINTRYLIQ